MFGEKSNYDKIQKSPFFSLPDFWLKKIYVTAETSNPTKRDSSSIDTCWRNDFNKCFNGPVVNIETPLLLSPLLLLLLLSSPDSCLSEHPDVESAEIHESQQQLPSSTSAASLQHKDSINVLFMYSYISERITPHSLKKKGNSCTSARVSNMFIQIRRETNIVCHQRANSPRGRLSVDCCGAFTGAGRRRVTAGEEAGEPLFQPV